MENFCFPKFVFYMSSSHKWGRECLAGGKYRCIWRLKVFTLQVSIHLIQSWPGRSRGGIKSGPATESSPANGKNAFIADCEVLVWGLVWWWGIVLMMNQPQHKRTRDGWLSSILVAWTQQSLLRLCWVCWPVLTQGEKMGAPRQSGDHCLG